MTRYSTTLEAILLRAQPLARVFLSAGYSFFLVGGVVRDEFLGISGSVRDLDVTTDARPQQIKALLSEVADELWLQGQRFGTIGCIFAGQSYEITTHRAESYVEDSRQPQVVFGDDIIADLARRDFTVNAMAINAADHTLVDPFAGRDDLQTRVLRTPLAPEVSLSEDPLRILRAARFCAACDLEVVAELATAMNDQAHRLAIVSVERIRDELQRLLLLPNPGQGLDLLDQTGVGSLVPVVGVYKPWLTAANFLLRLPADAAMRWAGLLFGLQVKKVNLRELKFSARLAREVTWFHNVGGDLLKEDLANLSDHEIRLLAKGCPRDRSVNDLFTYLVGLRSAAALDDVDAKRALDLVADLCLREPDFHQPKPYFGGLQVAEILGVKPGPELGQAMDFLAELRLTQGPLESSAVVRLLREWWGSRSPN